MKIYTTSDVHAFPGEVYSHKMGNFRKHLEENSTCNFFVFRGLKYDSKTDRYTATFDTSTGTGERRFDVKCSNDSAQFLLQNADKRGTWYLSLMDGMVTDVTFFDYNN